MLNECSYDENKTRRQEIEKMCIRDRNYTTPNMKTVIASCTLRC